MEEGLLFTQIENSSKSICPNHWGPNISLWVNETQWGDWWGSVLFVFFFPIVFFPKSFINNRRKSKEKRKWSRGTLGKVSQEFLPDLNKKRQYEIAMLPLNPWNPQISLYFCIIKMITHTWFLEHKIICWNKIFYWHKISFCHVCLMIKKDLF